MRHIKRCRHECSGINSRQSRIKAIMPKPRKSILIMRVSAQLHFPHCTTVRTGIETRSKAQFGSSDSGKSPCHLNAVQDDVANLERAWKAQGISNSRVRISKPVLRKECAIVLVFPHHSQLLTRPDRRPRDSCSKARTLPTSRAADLPRYVLRFVS